MRAMQWKVHIELQQIHLTFQELLMGLATSHRIALRNHSPLAVMITKRYFTKWELISRFNSISFSIALPFGSVRMCVAAAVTAAARMLLLGCMYKEHIITHNHEHLC